MKTEVARLLGDSIPVNEAAPSPPGSIEDSGVWDLGAFARSEEDERRERDLRTRERRARERALLAERSQRRVRLWEGVWRGVLYHACVTHGCISASANPRLTTLSLSAPTVAAAKKEFLAQAKRLRVRWIPTAQRHPKAEGFIRLSHPAAMLREWPTLTRALFEDLHVLVKNGLWRRLQSETPEYRKRVSQFIDQMDDALRRRTLPLTVLRNFLRAIEVTDFSVCARLVPIFGEVLAKLFGVGIDELWNEQGKLKNDSHVRRFLTAVQVQYLVRGDEFASNVFKEIVALDRSENGS